MPRMGQFYQAFRKWIFCLRCYIPHPHISLRCFQDLMKDRTTVLFTTSFFLLLSLGFTMRAYFESRPPNCASIPAFDDNFYSTLAGMVVSVCSIYLIVVPLLRSHFLFHGYKIWYRMCLCLSILASIASSTAYPYSWRASVVLTSVSSLSQLIGTLQLIECFQGAVDTSDVGSVELHLVPG